ncbi:MAG: response regulator [Alphaproteobacteria bacterium]
MKNGAVHFLLVDDLEENLLSLDALLKRDGLVLHKARSGQEALELLLQHDMALALLDVQMPEMDGFELAETMRATERTRGVPIIFLTAGSADSKRRFRGYEAGAVDYIEKPVEADVLRSKAQVFFDLALQRNALQEAAAALVEADRRKDEFLATLAHELRNPLAPIRNGLQIMRLSPDGTASPEVRDMMERQLSHLVRLIDDLLDVARVSQGKIDLRKERIPVATALQAAVEASRPLIESRGHELVLDVTDEDLWVEADLTRLAQIVGNLLNNAAKYTAEGGRIVLGARREGREALISVADNGRGIPPGMLRKVFDLFTQIDRDVQQSQGGLGIGLALVRQLVGMHGGSIDAVSTPGEGSTFNVRLPLTSAAAQPQEAPPAEEPGAGHLRVLVVDDNVASAKTSGWMLEMLGHEPHLAHDGPGAIEAAKSFRPDVILLDIGLPGMSGYEVARALRADGGFGDTVLIAQTGWGQARDREEARAAGFDHHLTKPVDFDQFTRLLAGIHCAAA